MKRAALLIPVATLLLSACATTPQQQEEPEWLDGSSKKFPAALYLTGQGSATELNDAKDRAYGDLAKQFEVAVLERSRQNQSYSRNTKQGETIEALDQEISRNLVTSTSRSLQGVELGEQWRDKINKRYHVLAVLSRSRAQEQFEQEITALDSGSAEKLKQAEAEFDPLKRAALIQQAIDTQRQRSGVQSSLQVVDPSGRGRPPTLSLAQLARSRDAIINKIRVATNASGELSDDLQQQLGSAANSAGFFLDEANADYTLNANIKLDPPIMQQGWYWLRGTLELSMKDKEGRDAGVKRWPLKASSTTLEQAKQKLLSDTNDTLIHGLREAVLEFGNAPEPAAAPAKR